MNIKNLDRVVTISKSIQDIQSKLNSLKSSPSGCSIWINKEWIEDISDYLSDKIIILKREAEKL